MQDLFKNIAMGLETKPHKLRPTMLSFLRELEPAFKALPVKKFLGTTLKEELEASADMPELKKPLLQTEFHSRQLLLACMVITTNMSFFLKLFKASEQKTAMEIAGASLLEGLSPYLEFLTEEHLVNFFKGRVALRSSAFKKPLDQLAMDLIKSDPFSTNLFDPAAVEKVTNTFGMLNDRSVSWKTLLVTKGGKRGPGFRRPARPYWSDRRGDRRGGSGRGRARGRAGGWPL